METPFMTIRRYALPVALGLFAASPQALADPTYLTVDIPNSFGTSLIDINKSGATTGFYLDQSFTPQGFIRTADGTVIYLAKFDDTMVLPDAINRKGQTAGQLGSGGYITAPNGTFTFFQPPGAKLAGARNLNDRGVAVGDFEDAAEVTHGFVRSRNGNIRVIDVRGAGTAQFQGTSVDDINNGGTISGTFIDSAGRQHGFLREPGKKTVKFDAPGAANTVWAKLNESGTIVGTYTDANSASHGYLRMTDGTFVTFDANNAGHGAKQGTKAYDINANGIVAGDVVDAGNHSYGFLRSANGKVVVFDEPDAGEGEGGGTYFVKINDANQISGGYTDTIGIGHGFIRTP